MHINGVILCAACNERLWEICAAGAGLRVAPAQPEVPPFTEGTSRCPFCDQEYSLEGAGRSRLWIREAEGGHRKVV